MTRYLKYEISSNPFIPDIISGLLWQLKISGINENEKSLSVFVTDDSDVNETEIRKQLDSIKAQKIIEDYSIKIEEFENKNWNEIWEESRKVIRISDRIVVKPSFKDYKPDKNEIVLTIDPKMSFGTGDHESTKLVLRLLEKYVREGDSLLDVGSGTGILAIVAIKLGAKSAIAVDNDPVCYKNCIENCRLNGVEGRVKTVEGVISKIGENNFDLIAANIQKNILLEISNQINSKIKPGGKAILSGLLIKDEEEILHKYESLGFIQTEIKYLNEWFAIVFENK